MSSLLCSLGVGCFNTSILTKYNIRHNESLGFSTPFDTCVWHNIDSFYSMLVTDFEDFFNDIYYDNESNIFKNKKYDIRFRFDNEQDINALFDKYEKRVKNWRKLVNDKFKKYFILTTIYDTMDCSFIKKTYDYISQYGTLIWCHITKEDIGSKHFSKEELNRFNYCFIKNPYPSDFPNNEWYKPNFYNTVEGLKFEKKYVDHIVNTVNL